MLTSVRPQSPVTMAGMQNEVKMQATKLAANISGIRESALTSPLGDIKGPKAEDFPALVKNASLETLFKCGEDAEALKAIFTNSDNVAARRAVTEFAGLFRTALSATSYSPAATDLLIKVGEEYTAQIVKDGLKEKSAFGPWMPATEKAEAKLKTLHQKLLSIITDNTDGDLGKLSTNFVMQEVMPYVASCIEHQFGCTLDPLTRSNLTQLIDRAAAKAVDALEMCHQKLTQEQGVSLGKEARHLELKALIPLLLRNVFTQIPVERLPDPKIPEPAAGPVPDGGKKAEPTGINININIDSSNRSVDNSKHINNSRSHIDNSQRHIDNSNHDNSRKTIDNSRTFIDNSQRHDESHYSTNTSRVSHSHSRVDSTTHQTETAHSASTGAIDHGTAGKIDVTAHATAEAVTNASSESKDGKVVTSEKGTTGERSSFDKVDGVTSKVIIDKPIQNTVHSVNGSKEHNQTTEIVDDKPLTSQFVGVEQNKINTLQAENSVITGNKADTTANDNSQIDGADEYPGLKFKQNSFLSAIPSNMSMRSVSFNARDTFLGVVRKALEPDTSTPFSSRVKFDELRAKILPNDSIKSATLKAQCSELNNNQELKKDIDKLKGVINQHPQKGKLAEVAQRFVREAGLTKLKEDTDYLLSSVLDSILGNTSWRENQISESYSYKPVITTVDGLHMQR
ncbi:type III secretion system effector SipA [Salmonella enterica]|uniref:SPI-1 type III secretion system effector SipA n=1 Tax=Salmonella enterica TaxID=28901 RepID=UPI000B9FA17F|nr:SPI-1 type III secretion system effector SipA [Salmonella enterica]EBF2916670.1 SPI-1 type III secretion system effector SipA [Salmonella enterica subsp. enterica serovar Agama]EDS4913181.1 SPI-1 type III secretion system effector SipA [Salmonella enterica subsp. enterica serovar Hillingdon]EDU3843539.1 SPI-1 type III secretion system effector SipA [Salmonella enterica subsp. enterica serovar Essen]ECG9329139.1 SPI-1 type III secretion system effector SipA [Salmonella enterica]EHA2458337.1 